MKTFKVYMLHGSSRYYSVMREELGTEREKRGESGITPVAFGNDRSFLCFGGKAYAVFTGPDNLTKADFRKYGMKAEQVD